MQGSNRSIFRPEAVRRYMQGREQVILPRFISPRAIVCLWGLLGVLAAIGIGTWFARVPAYSSGPAIVIAPRQATPAGGDEVAVAIFLPPEALSRLQVGQPLFLTFDPAGQPLRRSIVAIDPAVSSPAAARRRFALDPSAAQAVSRPSAVVIARLEPLPAGVPASTYLGSVGRADIQIGARRIGSLLPLVSQLFGE